MLLRARDSWCVHKICILCPGLSRVVLTSQLPLNCKFFFFLVCHICYVGDLAHDLTYLKHLLFLAGAC